MSNREKKLVERKAFENGIITTVSAAGAALFCFELLYANLAFAGMMACFLMLGACIKGVAEHRTL